MYLQRNALFKVSMLLQWAFVMVSVGVCAQTINYQIRNNGYYPRGCFPVTFSESIPEFIISLIGLAITIWTFAQPHRALPFYFIWILFVGFFFSGIFPLTSGDLRWQTFIIFVYPVLGITSLLTITVSWLLSRKKRTEQGAAANP